MDQAEVERVLQTVKNAGAKATPERLNELGRLLILHPLSRRFTYKMEATEDNTIHTPDDVLGERFLRLGVLLTLEAILPGRLRMNVQPEYRVGTLISFISTALRASPYLLTEEVRGQLAGVAIPRHTLSPRLLPEPKLWLTLETGVTVADGVHVDYFVVSDYGSGFMIWVVGQIGDDTLTISERFAHTPTDDELANSPENVFVEGRSYEYGKVYPDDYPGDADDSQLRGEGGELSSVLRLFGFLNSPFIPIERQKASRAARRESIRTGSPIEDEVSFIILRRPDYGGKDSDNEINVEWKHRWIVSGHLRAQWYPSEQAHHLIWIAPYMKGPEDAPLLEHVYKVAR